MKWIFHHGSRIMKVKIGTQLEDQVYRKLKIAAARENRPIGELIQHAVTDYLHSGKVSGKNCAGLNRMLGRGPLKATRKQFKEIMDLDFYDQ